jgi:hypothetical protein
MVKRSGVGPGTEVGKQILKDFLDWGVTGRIPWGNAIGGADHYKSSKAYQSVSASAFRAQAKKIARMALEQITADDITRTEALNAGLQLPVDDVRKEESKPEVKRDNDTNTSALDRSFPIDSFNRNPWVRFGQPENVQQQGNVHDDDDVQDVDESDDEDFASSDADESGSDDSLSSEEFEAISLGELQNSRTPFLIEYPTGDKLLVIFPLDGNVSDVDANHFEFIQNNTSICRWGKIPKELENCVALIGLGSEKPSRLGFSDPDLMVVDAEIKKRFKANNYKRDENGDIWEVRATLELPFKCEPQFYTRDGRAIKSFRMRSNGRGFSWGFFWLLPLKPKKSKPKKLIAGKLVTIMSEEESSIYTEKTYKSKCVSK